ncbi:MAG TPA: DPP IV N-terminal domain-containing protein, partial [Patescibacteria group bacterium]|nr:DPP IV N-terminal domain-containing protein [Patescibacteria group bacterium]
MTRSPTPEDLYRFRIPTDPRLSPDGALVALTVQSVAPGRDGYRHAVWLVPADGSAAPRQATLGARHDTHPRFSPDGGTLAFLSDRRPLVEEEPDAPKDREDGTQVHLLPLGGGEARRLTDLPRGVEDFAWSPDGRSLVVRTTSFGATRAEDRRARRKPESPRPGATPLSDYRYFDRLQGMLNGPGFIDDKVAHLWLVDVETGAAHRLTDGPTSDTEPAWSPDGTRIAFTASRGRDHDLDYQFDVFIVDVATRRVTRITDGAGCAFGNATWLPDGATLAVVGHRWPRGGGSRNDIWLFPADGSEAHRGGGRNLSGPTDLMVGASMGSDVTPGEAARLSVTPDGRHVLFTAPVRGSYELWRIALADGAAQRLTEDRHYLSGWHAIAMPDGGVRVAAIRSTVTALSDVAVLDLGADGSPSGSSVLRPITSFNAAVLEELDVRAAEERWETVDGRA